MFDAPEKYRDHWNEFARDILRVNLDEEQQKLLYSIQTKPRVTVKSGNGRGKDWTAATASLCFLYTNIPAKVINTAPTGRQVVSIMMSEISKIHAGAYQLGGTVLNNRITFEGHKEHFLEGFKAADKNEESWQGYHAPNLMLVITEASGISDETFGAIEGILTGNSKLLIVGNPMRLSGEFAKSFKDKTYTKHTLNCLDAPNVKGKKNLIPGQVDWDWVDDKVKRWCVKIRQNEKNESFYDFEWENEAGKNLYRPNDLFRIKVLGEFPLESPDQLIPLSWIELSNQRWHEWNENGHKLSEDMRLGVDVAGMGRDRTVFVERHKNIVSKIEYFQQAKHMETAGRVKIAIQHGGTAFVDTIGEGAGVYSRLEEQGVQAVSAKFSESAENLTDATGQIEFSNMRSYAYFSVRDALDPQGELKLAMPPDDDLTADLTETKIIVKSSGKYAIEEKDKIKSRLGRSPDAGDALALTFYPWGTGTGESMWSAKVREE